MLEFIKNEANKAYTENGAVSYATTNSYCLDLFATIGGLRRESEEEIITRFMRAFAENRDFAMKILFFGRDVRGGLGERRVFRVILKWLCNNESKSVIKNIEYIAEYGRYDDLLILLDTPCEMEALNFIGSQLSEDIEGMGKNEEISLLAKWLPSVNASNKETVRLAKRIIKYLRITDAEYRKMLAKLRAYIRIIENNLRERDYTFDYSKQPSKAMLKYRKAFIRNDGKRYAQYIDDVSSGKSRMNTGTLAPYEIIAPLLRSGVSDKERASLDATWNALEDFTDGKNSLVVVDGSGSMYWDAKPSPASVALSLGIYYAQRNTGAFRNCFITFSENPRLVEIQGEDIAEMVRYCASFNEVANTNIQKVFELVLNAAVKNNVPQEEMPETLYIISDMEFDCCAKGSGITNFEYAKKLFESNGYKLPEVVFWNVASRNRQQPVTKNEQGVALVSGCTPRIFSMLTSGNLSPEKYMLQILESERYSKITA